MAAALMLTGCNQQPAATAQPSRLVKTEIVKLTQRRQSITLTGDVQARVLADANQQRGEFVLVVAGAEGDAADAVLAEGRRVFALLREELPPARAAKLAAAITGAPRKALYE